MSTAPMFTGKIALVTGAGSGIGHASALAFAREGATVVVADVQPDAGQAVVAELQALGATAGFWCADVTKEDEVRAMVAGIVEQHGRIDFAHNNVGHSHGLGLDELSEEDWNYTVDITLKAPWLCMKYELPQMVRQGGGAVVNTASMAGVRYSPPANIAYSAAKAGVIQMTAWAAAHYAARSIRVNCISPGLVRTPAVDMYFPEPQRSEYIAAKQPLGRIVEPSDIADSVIFLCSERASMITGTNVHVAGGYQVI